MKFLIAIKKNEILGFLFFKWFISKFNIDDDDDEDGHLKLILFISNIMNKDENINQININLILFVSLNF